MAGAGGGEEPVTRKPTNLVAAMPRFARNAARIAPPLSWPSGAGAIGRATIPAGSGAYAPRRLGRAVRGAGVSSGVGSKTVELSDGNAKMQGFLSARARLQ